VAQRRCVGGVRNGLARLDREMTDSMVPSPSFSGRTVLSEDSLLEEWRTYWVDDRYEYFVAERNGLVIGHTVLFRRPPDLRVPKDSIDLAQMSTPSEATGE
jgi:hypothetical protein